MHRLALAALAASAAVAAPLLSQAASGAARASPSAAAALRLPWDLLDCTFVIALLPVEDGGLRARLPPGFEPTVPALALALPSPVHEVAVEVDDCASGAGLAGRVPRMQYASIWAAARPPEKPTPPPASAYFVNWDVLVPDADRRALLLDHGLPARDGALALARPEPLADLRHEVEARMSGFGSWHVDSLAPVLPQNFDSDFLQFTPTEDGRLATWFTKYKSTELRRGEGVVQLSPGSWLADLVGTGTIPARILAGKWSYTDGEIVLP